MSDERVLTDPPNIIVQVWRWKNTHTQNKEHWLEYFVLSRFRKQVTSGGLLNRWTINPVNSATKIMRS